MKTKIRNSKAYIALLFALTGISVLFFSNSIVSAESTVVTPEADAFVVEEVPHLTTGNMPLIRAQAFTEMNAYLRFNVQIQNGEVSGALLRLKAMDTNGDGFQIHRVDDDNWNESTINFQNAPALGDVIASHTDAIQKGAWITIDVSNYVTDNGVYSFAVSSNGNNRMRWQSRENQNAPELIINVSAPSTPQPTSTTQSTSTTEPTMIPTTPPTATQPPATLVPTASPTIVPTEEPTIVPTEEPTAVPTNTPSPSPTATVEPTQPPPPTATSQPGNLGNIVVNHNSVDKFDEIPEQYLQAAARMNMLFVGRSVSSNINDGLNCLSYSSDEAAPNHCSRYAHVNPAYSVDPSIVSWYHPGGYNRSNWTFRFWEGTNCSYWYDKIDCFIDMTSPNIDHYDVVSLQYSYLAVEPDSSIADQPGGYFWNNPNRLDVYDQEQYEAAHPNTIFIYSTTSLSRGLGSGVSDAFNQQMRAYAAANGKPLFDVADILSHDPNGNPCYDNRDGVYYSNGNNSENHPNDGVQNLAICPHYTTETDGGHLGNVSAGKIRVAQAYWVLMAQLAGWDGVSQ